jgi:tetratricopeptide (TPR) repeat protein
MRFGPRAATSPKERIMSFRKLSPWSVFLLVAALSLSGCRKKAPEEIFAEAWKLFQRQDVLGAMFKSQDLIKKHPDSEAAANARMLLATCQMQNGDMEEARRTLDQIVKREGLRSQRGQTAYVNRLRTWPSPDKAIAEILRTSATLAVAPDFARQIQLLLGSLYAENKQPEKAKAHFAGLMKTAKSEEEAFAALESLVSLFMEEKNYGKALDLYRNRLKEKPNSKDRGILLFAIAAMHKRIAEATKDPQIKQSEEKAAKETFDGSAEVFRKQIASEPLERNKTVATIRLSRVFRSQGDGKKADETLESSAKQSKSDETREALMWELAEACRNRKDVLGSRRRLQDIAKAFPNRESGRQASVFVARIDQMLKAQAGRTTSTLGLRPPARGGTTSGSLVAPAQRMPPTMPAGATGKGKR